MSERRAYRPMLNDRLEDRSVPSGFGPRALISVPAQDAAQVARAFNDFERTYAQDVRTILLKSGTTDLAAARTAFDQAIATELGKLNTKLDGIVNNLPANTTLDQAFSTALLSTTPPASPDTSLQGVLAALKTPTDTTFRSTRSFIRLGTSAIDSIGDKLTAQVRNSPPPTGSIDATTLKGDVQAVHTAFRTFNQSYRDAVNNVLLPSGTTDPSTNRTAFNAAVLTALQKLSTDVTAAVANLPAGVTTTLNTTLQNRLLSTTPAASPDNSLQGRLAAITTPKSNRFFATAFFRLRSFGAIGDAEFQVVRDITDAASKYNSSLSGTATT